MAAEILWKGTGNRFFQSRSITPCDLITLWDLFANTMVEIVDMPRGLADGWQGPSAQNSSKVEIGRVTSVNVNPGTFDFHLLLHLRTKRSCIESPQTPQKIVPTYLKAGMKRMEASLHAIHPRAPLDM